jgi:hypothetical protein
MVEELKHIHYQALEGAMIYKSLGNAEEVERCRAIMACTYRYKDSSKLGLQLGSLPNLLTGGDSDVKRLGTPGDYEMP